MSTPDAPTSLTPGGPGAGSSAPAVPGAHRDTDTDAEWVPSRDWTRPDPEAQPDVPWSPAPAAAPTTTAPTPSWTPPEPSTGPGGPGDAAGAPPPPGQGTAEAPRGGSPLGGAGRLGRGIVAAAVVVLLLAGGYGLGQWRYSATHTASAGSAGIPVTVTPTQIQGSSQEPVVAVAKALLPAVVQIERSDGLGSGVIYDSRGYIVTAAHVVDGVDQVVVRLADGTSLQGKVLGTNTNTDIGVVKVNRTGLPVAALARNVKLQVGQTAVAIGSPFGLEGSVTTGVVSAVSRNLQTSNGTMQVIQTDAPINPGNSGGALADREGQVIGINDSISSQSGGNEGVGFAVPIDTAAASAAQIVSGQPAPASGFLGVSGTDPTLGRAGALINQVEPGSPAGKAGIQVGDLIVAVNGQAVRGWDALGAQVSALHAGSKAQVTLIRNGKQMTVTATLASRQGSTG
jgi:S1-C subfamily serine protease